MCRSQTLVSAEITVLASDTKPLLYSQLLPLCTCPLDWMFFGFQWSGQKSPNVFFLGLFVFPYPARSSERLSRIFTHIWLRIGTLEFNFEHCSAICGAGVGTDVSVVFVVFLFLFLLLLLLSLRLRLLALDGDVLFTHQCLLHCTW